MMEQGEITKRLFERLSGAGEKILVEEVRIGLGYVGVKLEDNRMGLAAVLRNELCSGCSVLENAGHLTGEKSTVLLKRLIEGNNPLQKALGLAVANALIYPPASEDKRDSIEIIKLTSQDKVAMIGFFAPLIQKIKDTGATLTIIERDPSLIELPDEKGKRKILQECTVAIITATTLLNNTLENVLGGLARPRHVLVLGPSTPLCSEIFQGTPVNHLGGSVVLNIGKAMQIISEGGGTPNLRPYLRFLNMLVKLTLT